MTTRKPALIAALAVFLIAGATALRTAQADAAPTQLAVINIVRVFSSLDEQKDGTAEIDKNDREATEKRRKMEDDLTKANDALRGPNPLYKRGSPEYKMAEDKLLEDSMTYQAFLSLSDAKHLMLVRLKTIDLYRKINDAVEKYAKANGVAIVFVINDIDLDAAKDMTELKSQIAMRKILYAHPNYDITENVIKAMNADYKLGASPK